MKVRPGSDYRPSRDGPWPTVETHGQLAPAERECGQVAEPAPQPRRGARGQPRDGGGEDADQPGRRRRSRAISTAIGMTDSTITMPTTTWM